MYRRYYPKNVIALYFVDTADKLENELSAHCDVVFGEGDILGHKIQSFIEHSNATIIRLKEKYDQLRINNDELLNKYPTSYGTSGVAVGVEGRRETSSPTGKHKETIGMYSGGSYAMQHLFKNFCSLI